MYIVKRQFQGDRIYSPGEEVPEAPTWANFKALLNLGWIEEVTEMEEKKEKKRKIYPKRRKKSKKKRGGKTK